MSQMTIEVERRETRGKNSNRRLRASGQVPAVVYGGGKEPLAVQVEQRKFAELLREAGGGNVLFLLKLAGTDQSRHTMIRDLQENPVTGALIHVDFLRVSMGQKLRMTIPIELEGEAFGVKTEGGMLDFITREVEVECPADAIPRRFTIDVNDLNVGQHVEAGQLDLPDGVTLNVEPARVILSIVGKRGAEAEEEEGEELLEEASAEPEVAKRGKAEGE